MTYNEYYNKQDISLHLKLEFPSKMQGTPVLQSLGYTDGSLTGSKTWEGNDGIYREVNFTVMVDDAPYIYKAVSLDNRSEHLAYGLDTILNLNLVPYVRPYTLTLEEIETAYYKTWGEKMPITDSMRVFLKNEISHGGGYFMEFYPHAITDTLTRNVTSMNMLLTKEGRYSFMKLYMLDFLTSNRDSRRDASNWLVSCNNDLVAIDNSLTGCTSFDSYHNRLPEKRIPFSISLKEIPCPVFFDTGRPYSKKAMPDVYPFVESVKMLRQSNIGKEFWLPLNDIKVEAYSCFLKHFNPCIMQAVTTCLDWEFDWNVLAAQEEELCMKFVNSISVHIIQEIGGACEFYNQYVAENRQGKGGA